MSSCTGYGFGWHTVDSIDADDILDDRRALIWRFPVQQHAVGLDAGKRHKRGDGHLEAQQVDELVDGF